jgi:hypothetical protein
MGTQIRTTVYSEERPSCRVIVKSRKRGASDYGVQSCLLEVGLESAGLGKAILKWNKGQEGAVWKR